MNLNLAKEFMYNSDSRVVTPETLAWDLIMSNDITDFGGVMENLVSGESNPNNLLEVLNQNLVDEFQILITIYIEMLYYVMKSNFMASILNERGELDADVDLEAELDKYKPDLSMYKVDDMIELFRSKFKKIRYYLSIQDITEFCDSDPNDFGMFGNYYCKVLLLDDKREYSTRYFEQASHIPPDKRYTFLMKNIELKSKLEEFYAVMYLPPYNGDRLGRKVKISFSKFNVI